MTRKRRSRSEWIAICEAFEASGEEAAVFARRRGLHQSTLRVWRSRLRNEAALSPSPASFVEVVRESETEGPPVIVRLGEVTVEFHEAVPAPSWVLALAGRC